MPTVTPRYELNEETGMLEEVGIRDDYAFVQSSAETAFDKVLERLGYFDSPEVELYDPKKVKFVDDTPLTDNFEEVGADMRVHSAELKKNIEKEMKENEKENAVEESK